VFIVFLWINRKLSLYSINIFFCVTYRWKVQRFSFNLLSFITREVLGL